MKALLIAAALLAATPVLACDIGMDIGDFNACMQDERRDAVQDEMVDTYNDAIQQHNITIPNDGSILMPLDEIDGY